MIPRTGLAALLMSGSMLVTPAAAQDAPLADLLSDLILRDVVLPGPAAPGPRDPGPTHEVHFSPIAADELTNPAVAIVQTFNTLLATQLSTFPLGGSTGGLTYTFDETLGTFRRGSNSFGPAFTERAITIGRRRLSVGLNYQHTSYESFEGENLDDGSIQFYLRHEECCSVAAGGGGGGGTGTGGGRGGGSGIVDVPDGTRLSPFFEGDLIETSLSLDATNDTVAFFANYGLTDRWDVGLAVPIVRVELDASVRARIIRLSTEARPFVHTFEAGNAEATERTFRRGGSASGLGDIVLRTKYNVWRIDNGGLAAALDLRLPTGDADDLLGSGGTLAKVFVVASGETGRFGQHANFGYTFASGDAGGILGPMIAPALNTSLPNEFNYAGGVEFVVTPRFTVLADIVGRSLQDVGRLGLTTKMVEYQPPGSSVQPPPSFQFNEFESRKGNLSLALGAVGFKANLVGDLLISGHVLFPLTDAGLRSGVTPVVGADYAF